MADNVSTPGKRARTATSRFTADFTPTEKPRTSQTVQPKQSTREKPSGRFDCPVMKERLDAYVEDNMICDADLFIT